MPTPDGEKSGLKSRVGEPDIYSACLWNGSRYSRGIRMLYYTIV